MVMGCQGDIHLFCGPGPQLRGEANTDGGGGQGEQEQGGTARQETPRRCSSPQAWPGGSVSQVLTGKDRGWALGSGG